MLLSRRRILAAAGTTLVAPSIALGQEPGRNYRIGSLNPTPPPYMTPDNLALREELRKAGFIEGKNLNFERRGADIPLDHFPALAVELVQSGVDAIQCNSNPVIFKVAQSATRDIPIFGVADDMVASGIVSSLAHHGGNTTGISILAGELDVKRQEIVMELLPRIDHIGALADASVSSTDHLRTLRESAVGHGVELSIEVVRRGEDQEILTAIDRLHAAGTTALNVLASGFLNQNRRAIIGRAAALKLPAIYQWSEMVREGGLIAYGPSLSGIGRQLGRLVIKLLRGVKPSEIPVEQPTTFELVVNLKTAKALGLAVPPSLLARADEVIE